MTKISVEMVRLFVDFIEHVRLWNLLYENCKEKEQFVDLDCCEAHKFCKRQYEKLYKRATKLAPSSIREHQLEVLSPTWWGNNGFNYSSDVKIVD